MFEVIFEVCPHSERWEAYLAVAKSLRPLLEQQKGFIANVRYKSLTRPGWILSLSDWENEKALIRWRTQTTHHHAQESGRENILSDYHLRVGEVLVDTAANASQETKQQRFDETEVGEAKVVTLTNTRISHLVSSDRESAVTAEKVLEAMDFDFSKASGLVSWDVFEAILTPGEVLVLCSWVDQQGAEGSLRKLGGEERTRQVRVIRDYGMVDRQEAPQYYPTASS